MVLVILINKSGDFLIFLFRNVENVFCGLSSGCIICDRKINYNLCFVIKVNVMLGKKLIKIE